MDICRNENNTDDNGKVTDTSDLLETDESDNFSDGVTCIESILY